MNKSFRIGWFVKTSGLGVAEGYSSTSTVCVDLSGNQELIDTFYDLIKNYKPKETLEGNEWRIE